MSFLQKYLHEVELIAKSINISKVEEMIEILFQVKSNKGRLFILGIGGSAGNAGHAVNDFRKLAGKSAPIALLGYEVITDEDENLGPIEEVIEQPHQVLLKISLEGNEALIPLHAESLDSIDHDAKKVYVILPDGLLDVYRS